MRVFNAVMRYAPYIKKNVGEVLPERKILRRN